MVRQCNQCSNYWRKDFSLNFECRLGHYTPDFGETDAEDCSDFERLYSEDVEYCDNCKHFESSFLSFSHPCKKGHTVLDNKQSCDEFEKREDDSINDECEDEEPSNSHDNNDYSFTQNTEEYSSSSHTNQSSSYNHSPIFSSTASRSLSIIATIIVFIILLIPFVLVSILPALAIADFASFVLKLSRRTKDIECLASILVFVVWSFFLIISLFIEGHKKTPSILAIAFLILITANISEHSNFKNYFKKYSITNTHNKSTQSYNTPSRQQEALPISQNIKINIDAVFRISNENWKSICEKCTKTGYPDMDCISNSMRENGASKAAINFTKYFQMNFKNHDLAYLSDIQNHGKIALAQVTAPTWNHPDTTEYVLLNGSPALILIAEYISKINITNDKNYKLIIQTFPKADIGLRNEQVFIGHQADSISESFIFRVNLLNGCRGCEIAGSADVVFKFDNSGKLIEVKLEKLNASTNGTNIKRTFNTDANTYEETDPALERKITYEDLKKLSKAELDIKRNEIYARHGWVFMRKDLAKYFSQKAWYRPYMHATDIGQNNFLAEESLTDIDRYNIKTIKNYESGLQ